MQYRLSSVAEEDVCDIWLYIADDNVAAADRLLDRFTRTFELLAKNPQIGQAQDHLRPGLRRFVVGNYLVFFQPCDDGLLIVRVLHAARQIEKEFLD